MDDITVSYKDTSEIEVPEKLVDQVIGQDRAVEIIRKSAEQRRHTLLIGQPGTGKSLLARAMAEIMPKTDLKDIIITKNPEDENKPKVVVVSAGMGERIANEMTGEKARGSEAFWFFLLYAACFGMIIYAAVTYQIYVVIINVAAIVLAAIKFPRGVSLSSSITRGKTMKVLVSNEGKTTAPFVDATGAHEGALLGDVRHDPWGSTGGLGESPHKRVEPGDIHRANGGVLFIDEINTMAIETQQNLLTALQEGQYPITAHNPQSSGATTKTEPVPCKFVMVAAGNVDAIKNMHPALRNRIRGYGYEVYMEDSMPDTDDNRNKLARFVAQEVKRDGNIPHFDNSAIVEVIREARRRSRRSGHLTLELRTLGGLVRAAGDIALSLKAPLVSSEHVLKARGMARSVEEQIVDKYTEYMKDYDMDLAEGSEVGRVNGLAVVGSDAGKVLPIIAAVTTGKGKVTATGMLKDIAKESVINVSAVVKNLTGKDTTNMDIYVQFAQTYEGVDGDSASVSLATAIISAIENTPVRQDVAMTGSLTVRGLVLPIGGVTHKIEAAAKAGIKKVLVPFQNMKDIVIDDEYKEKVEIIPVKTIYDVLYNSLDFTGNEELLGKITGCRK